MRSLNNFRAEQPHQHAMYYLRLLMTEVAWTKDELKEALDGETLSTYSLMLSSLFSKIILVYAITCCLCFLITYSSIKEANCVYFLSFLFFFFFNKNRGSL